MSFICYVQKGGAGSCWSHDSRLRFLCPSCTHNLVTTSLSHTTVTRTILLGNTPSFSYNFVTHNSSHTTFLILDHPPLPLYFLSSPSPLQHLLLIIGRSWLVGLCGPFIFIFFFTYIYLPTYLTRSTAHRRPWCKIAFSMIQCCLNHAIPLCLRDSLWFHMFNA